MVQAADAFLGLGVWLCSQWEPTSLGSDPPGACFWSIKAIICRKGRQRADFQHELVRPKHLINSTFSFLKGLPVQNSLLSFTGWGFFKGEKFPPVAKARHHGNSEHSLKMTNLFCSWKVISVIPEPIADLSDSIANIHEQEPSYAGMSLSGEMPLTVQSRTLVNCSVNNKNEVGEAELWHQQRILGEPSLCCNNLSEPLGATSPHTALHTKLKDALLVFRQICYYYCFSFRKRRAQEYVWESNKSYS